MSAARLERDVSGRPPACGGLLERDGLGVGAAVDRVPAFGDDRAFLDEHAAHQRVRKVPCALARARARRMKRASRDDATLR